MPKDGPLVMEPKLIDNYKIRELLFRVYERKNRFKLFDSRLRSVYLQHVTARLFDDENEGHAYHAQNDDRKLHKDIGTSTCKRSLGERLDEIFQYDCRHGVQTRRQ